ncbi:MAG: hypothetical protein AMR96_05105 [Candidatus Adiutrix intracellularis]|nr:MAG: hypothetical protein AMR96_05105 [Candidatus Adiutrix intracellularis]
MFKLVQVCLFSLFYIEASLCVLLAQGCGGYVYKLPSGIKVGSISGSGTEIVTRALTSRVQGGITNSILSGQISLNRQVDSENEIVPLKVAASQSYFSYQPDPFTRRLWIESTTPSTTQLTSFKFERLTGNIIFNWRLISPDEQDINKGQIILDINCTKGGFLAAAGAAPPLNDSRVFGAVLENRLADELVSYLALNLGRTPSALELESGRDKLSRKAKILASAGDWEGAKKLWLELLIQNPKYAVANYNLGLYWERQKIRKKPGAVIG